MRKIKVGDRVNIIKRGYFDFFDDRFGRHKNLVVSQHQKDGYSAKFGESYLITDENKNIFVHIFESQIKKATCKVRRIK